MILDEVTSDVSSQLTDQLARGVRVESRDRVPETGPANQGMWWRITNVTAVFADLKGSTKMSVEETRRDAAVAYTLFIRAMSIILDRFDARYVDIQGDGVFGLFSGPSSRFLAAACAVTMRTEVERVVDPLFRRDTSADSELTVGIGIDEGTVLVRRLGLRNVKLNEVWAGKPVNVAAKLSSVAEQNQIVVSDRVFGQYRRSSMLRQRALIWSCGCDNGRRGGGLAIPRARTTNLWRESPAPDDLGLDFFRIHRLNSPWCRTHGAEFCEAMVSGRKPWS